MLLYVCNYICIVLKYISRGDKMIIDEVKKANMQAMKDRDMVARSIYSVLLNKFMLEGIKRRETGKEMVDADYVQILQKTTLETSPLHYYELDRGFARSILHIH